MDEKRSLSFCHSPEGGKMSELRVNLDCEFSNAEDENTGNMHVYARVRPMLQYEEEAGYKECIAAIDDTVVRALAPKSSAKFKNLNNAGAEIIEDFKYTQAFGPEVGQFKFFEQTIMSTMQNFIEGQNCLIFSYGITNSGKTYTLQGNEKNPGIIILGLKLFFASIEDQLLSDVYAKPDKFSDVQLVNDKDVAKELKLRDSLLQLYDQEVSNSTNKSSFNQTESFGMFLCELFSQKYKPKEIETTLLPEEMEACQSAEYMKNLCRDSAAKQAGKCNIWISFIEIYNEYIYDLLQPNVLQRQKLQLAEDQSKDVYVKGVREVCVANVDEALQLLHFGRKNLNIAATKLNYQSSRSHCIYTIKVVRIDEDSSSVRVNRLSFCDLAGSERASKADTSGMRLKEAGYINQSLRILGRCMEQLRLNQTAKDKLLIPFRESKLTRLFSGHFLGKGNAVMIANASPCEYTFDETINVLKFSALAKELTLNDTFISNSIQSISSQWAQSRAQASSFCLDESSAMENSLYEDNKEKDEMIEKLLEIATELRANLEKEKREKLELEQTIRESACKEYSESSDKIIAELKEFHDTQMDHLKDTYSKRIREMDKQHKQRMDELREQLMEYQNSSSETDESFKSTDGDNSAFIKESIDAEKVEKSLSESPENKIDADKNAVKVENSLSESPEDKKQTTNDSAFLEEINTLKEELDKYKEENKTLNLDLVSLKNQLEMSKMEEQNNFAQITDLHNEIEKLQGQITELQESSENMGMIKSAKQNEVERLSTDLISLNEDLKRVSDDLISTKEELDKTCLLLTEAQTSETAVKDKYVDVNSKLEEALQVLEQYEKEIANLKSLISEAEQKSVELNAEKENQQETILSLSEELATATELVEKLEAEKASSENSAIEEIGNLKEMLEETKEKLVSLQQSKSDEKSSVENLPDTSKVINEQKYRISSLETECEEYKLNHSKLLEKISDIEAEQVESEKEASQRFDDVKEKLNQANLKLKELESKCETLIAENKELNIKCVTFDEKIMKLKESNDKKEIVENEINEKLNKSTQEISDLKAKLFEMQSSCAIYLDDYKGLMAKYEKLESDFEGISDQITFKDSELEDLKNQLEVSVKEKESLMEQCMKMNKAINVATDDIKELDTKFSKCITPNEQLSKETEISFNTLNNSGIIFDKSMEQDDDMVSSKEVESYKVKITEMESERQNQINEHSRLLKMLEESELKSKAKCEEKDAKFQETIATLEDKCRIILELESECSTQKEETLKLKETCKTLEEKYNNIVSALDVKNTELSNQEQKVEEMVSTMDEVKTTLSNTKEKCDDFETLVQKLKEEKELLEEKYNELKNNGDLSSETIKELTEKLESAVTETERLKELNVQLENSCNEQIKQIAEYIDESKNTKKEITALKKEISKLEKEKQALTDAVDKTSDKKEKLIELLEKNECKASQKIDSLQGQITQYINEVEDMKRQISEKESSIAELEKGLLDSQEELKNFETKTQQQIFDLKEQHEIEIQESMRLKSESEKENSQLKNENKKLKLELQENAHVEESKTVQTKSSKDKSKKKSKAKNKDISTDEKENSDSYSESIKEESLASTKRTRRALRPRVENDLAVDDSDNEVPLKPQSRKRKSSDEFLPPKKMQKNTEKKVPVKKATRKILKDEERTENMSPVQKFSAYVGSKLRSVAQAVSDVPSPRKTRGMRKKLFNPDAVSISSASSVKSWKY